MREKLAIFVAMEMKSQVSQLIGRCAEDVRNIQSSETKISLDAQIRAYDLYEMLLDMPELSQSEKTAAEDFRMAYAEHSAYIIEAYDEAYLNNALKARMAPLERAATDARFEAASAASLHEFAKDTYEVWKTAGIFMRKRALKALRERAGFRLESHRIGNYVAKTFDLMNEAAMKYARSQQALFAANVAYKIKPGIFKLIDERFRA